MVLDGPYQWVVRSTKLVIFLDGHSRKIVNWELAFSISAGQISGIYDEALKKEEILEVDDKPDVIIDNGPRFLGQDMTGLLDKLGMDHRTIPVDHPESYGKIEVNDAPFTTARKHATHISSELLEKHPELNSLVADKGYDDQSFRD